MACGGAEALWCQGLPAEARFAPEPAQQALLQERHARFKALYPALLPHF